MQPHINPAYLSSGRFPSFPSHIVSQLEGSPSDGLHDYSHGEALTPSCSIVSETVRTTANESGYQKDLTISKLSICFELGIAGVFSHKCDFNKEGGNYAWLYRRNDGLR
jgi:hypothetical protein